jgi:hypothetical protein
MSRNFYYRKQADIVTGSAAMTAYVAAHFAALGLTSAQSSALAAADTALQAAYLVSSDPTTRTRVAVEATRVAITNLRLVAIPLARQVYANAAVNDSQLVAMGLLPRSGRQPSEHITEMPVLTVKRIQGRNVRLQVRGSLRGILPQADGAIIYSYVGATPPEGAVGWTSEGPISKSSTIVAFGDEVAVGARVWFAAQWFNSKGVGPGCNPVAAILGADGSLAA